ncbi:MAG: hypothetical protein RMM29_04760 [Planctomycetota bacterium]|nr:hypothetical protein [Planctomycetota bacterium]MCX8039986.1 hypothetical protein [Planctomycetota bacterium]MDW8372946.1 hypothetical protein [Planctomycetota bacterium]
MRYLPVVVLACCAIVAAAADVPLGQVVAVEDQAVTVRFDAAARVAPGQMIALFGPGRVVKHPLTGKVVTEQRRLLAKGQVIGVLDDGALRLRLTWLDDGAQPAKDWDAVPLPGEAAPNAPPVNSGPLPAIAAVAGGTVSVRIPVIDPDSDPLWFSWSLTGPAGQSGFLDALVTTVPENAWTVPVPTGEASVAVRVVATDLWGQQATWLLSATSGGEADPRRQRRVFARFGGEQEPLWTRIAWIDDGSWCGVDDDGRVYRVDPGWLQASLILPAGAVGRAVAVVGRARDLYVLDRDKLAVQVFGESRQLRRSMGGLGDPWDLAVAGDGTVFVADQKAGGVMVFDASGRFRARLGRLGDDGFTEVTRVCALPAGGVAVLDAKARRLHRYDEALRRLDAWNITGDPQIAPVDIAAHPRGLLVLLSDGSIQVYGPRGMVSETWKATSGGSEAAIALASAPSGVVHVVFARGRLVRLSADGRQNAVRGAGLTNRFRRIVVDGAGTIWGADSDERRLYGHDVYGWRTQSLGGSQRQGGPLSSLGAFAVQPNGSALVALDPDKRVAVRLAASAAGGAPIIFGGQGTNLGQFRDPIAVAVDEAGRSYILDEDLYRVSVFDANGQFLFAFGERGTQPHQFDEPTLIAVAPRGDAAFVFDEDRYEVKKFALDHAARQARHVGTGGGKGDDPGRFRKPVEMCVDRFGYLHIIDSDRGNWQVLDFRGQNLLPLHVIPFKDELRGATTGWVNPDGIAWLLAAGSIVGLR